jgi:hypothetical protein
VRRSISASAAVCVFITTHGALAPLTFGLVTVTVAVQILVFPLISVTVNTIIFVQY